MDLSLGASRLHGYSRLRQAAAEGAADRTLSVRLTQLGLHARIRRYPEPRSFPFDLWYGGGLTAGMLMLREQEQVFIPGGRIRRSARNSAYPFAGVQAMAGVDLYPLRDSALLLRLQTRYDLNAVPGGFRGHINGYAVQIGLLWNFWPVAP